MVALASWLKVGVGSGGSPQEREWPAHPPCLAAKVRLGVREVANALRHGDDSWHKGPGQQEVGDAPAPRAKVELVKTQAAKQKRQHAGGKPALAVVGAGRVLHGAATGAQIGQFMHQVSAGVAGNHGGLAVGLQGD